MDFMCGVSNLTPPAPLSPKERGEEPPRPMGKEGWGGEVMPTEALV